MAFVNVSKPAGLSPIEYLNGARYDGKGRIFSILAAVTNPIYVGDLVSMVEGGGATAADSRGIPAINLTAAGAAAVGVVVAVGVNPLGAYVNPANMGSSLNRPSGAQAINYYALVADDPNILYEIQEGNTGTNLTGSAVGRNANILYTAPASAIIPLSGTVLDNTTVAVTATLNLKIMRFIQRVDNNFVTNPATGGGAQKWQVMIQNHQYLTRPAAT